MFVNGRYVGPWFQQSDPPGGGGNPPAPVPDPAPNPEPPKPADPLDGLTPEQQVELNRRIAAARREGETNGKTKAQQVADDKAEADRIKKEQADEIAKGNFDSVKTKLEGERDGLKTDLDTTKTRLDRALDLLKSGIDAKVATLTKADPDLAKVFPSDADVLDQITWLDDPRTKAVIDKVEADERQSGAPRGNGRNPASATTEQIQERIVQERLKSGIYKPF